MCIYFLETKNSAVFHKIQDFCSFPVAEMDVQCAQESPSERDANYYSSNVIAPEKWKTETETVYPITWEFNFKNRLQAIISWFCQSLEMHKRWLKRLLESGITAFINRKIGKDVAPEPLNLLCQRC